MFILILSLAILALGLLGMFASRSASTPKSSRKGTLIGGLGLMVVGLALLATSFTTAIPARTVGVVTTFGKVSESTMNPGLNFKLPWQKVVKIDTTIQTDEYARETAIPVRIGDGSRGSANVTIRWSVTPQHANLVFQDFRSDDPTASFSQAVIVTQLSAATQKVLGNYNPIAQLEAVGGNELDVEMSFAPDYDEVAGEIYDEMVSRMGEVPLATIESVTVSFVSLSETTQEKLDGYVEAVGETRIAQQRAETATAQAEANRRLAQSVSKDPNVLVSRCLDIVSDAMKVNYQFNAGFNCWQGGGNDLLLAQNSLQSGTAE